MSDKPILFAREYRDLSWTPRWCIARVNRRQSVAEHHYYVSLYAYLIASLIGFPGERLGHLLVCALTHDVEESFTADWPGPVKRAVIDRVNYDSFVRRNVEARFGDSVVLAFPDLKAILDVAGLLDEVLYLSGEMQSGNQAVGAIIENSQRRLYEKIDAMRQTFQLNDSQNNILVSEIKAAIIRERGQCSMVVNG